MVIIPHKSEIAARISNKSAKVIAKPTSFSIEVVEIIMIRQRIGSHCSGLLPESTDKLAFHVVSTQMRSLALGLSVRVSCFPVDDFPFSSLALSIFHVYITPEFTAFLKGTDGRVSPRTMSSDRNNVRKKLARQTDSVFYTAQ